MNKFSRFILFAVSFFVGSIPISAQAPFDASYQVSASATATNSKAGAIATCSNGDILMAWNDDNGYAILTRVGGTGTTVWSIKFSDTDTTKNHQIRSIGENPNGTIWVFGYAYPASFVVYHPIHYFIQELSPTGARNWIKFYAATLESIFGTPYCLKMRDNGYLMRLPLGTYTQLMKADTSGNLIWGKAYSTDSIGNKYSSVMTTTHDSGAVMMGIENTETSFIKIDKNGNIITSITIQPWWQPGGDCYIFSICELKDSSIVVGGRASYDAYVARFDRFGNPIWNKHYSSTNVNTDMIYFMRPLSDGTFMALGNKDSPLNRDALSVMLHLDTSGAVLEAATYADTSSTIWLRESVPVLSANDELFILNVKQLPNRPILLHKIGSSLVGACNTVPINTSVINESVTPYLFKQWSLVDGTEVLDSLDIVSSDLNYTLLCNAVGVEESTATFFTINPNPSLLTDLMNFTSPAAGNWQLLDVAGRVIQEGNASIGYNQLASMPIASGVYFFRLLDEKGNLIGQQKMLRL